MIAGEFYKDKILCELDKNRGVRIGESSIVSTKLHLLNGGKGEAIVIKTKDFGNCQYEEVNAGSYVHIDTFHSTGYVDGSEVMKKLKEILDPAIKIDVQEKEEGTAYHGSTKNEFLPNSPVNRDHVHVAIKMGPDMYGMIIPAVWTIEEIILSKGLKLRKIKRFKCRGYRFFSSLLIHKNSVGLFGGEYSDIPTRMTKAGKDVCSLARGGRTGKNEGSDKIENSEKIQSVIRYLRNNYSLLKEKTEGEGDESKKVSMPYQTDDWIENIDISGTAVSLLKKGYWTNSDCEIEYKDIKLNKSPVKDYRNTIFIIDNSQSMRGDNIESAKRVVAEICRKLRGEAALVTFSDDKAYLYRRFTNNKETIKELIDKIEIQEVTPLAHGLNVAYEYAVKSMKKNVNIVLLTDGEPNVPFKSDCPLKDCVEVSALIRKKGFNLCCICTTEETSAVDKIIEAANGQTVNINSFKM